MAKRVTADALYRVFNEETKLTTFMILTFDAADERGLALKCVRREFEMNQLRNGCTHTFEAAGPYGSYDSYLSLSLCAGEEI